MNLFQKAKNLITPLHAPQDPPRSFVLTDHFRGYKALPVVVNGNQEAERNNNQMAGVNLSGHTITFAPAVYDGNHKMYHVLVDGLKMGAIFDDSAMQRVARIEKIYAKIDEETIIGEHETEKRARIRIFIKEA